MTIALIIGGIIVAAGAGLYVGVRAGLSYFMYCIDSITGRKK